LSHRERRITVHGRRGTEWSTHVAIAGGRVRIESTDAELVVDEIYRGSAIS